jgi:LacI family transcriptional regulator
MLSGRFGAMAFLSCGDLGFDWIPLSLLHGIHASLSAMKSRLVLDEVDVRTASDAAANPRLFRETAVDALLLYLHPATQEPLIKVLADMGIPNVWLNRNAPTRCVYPDEVQGGAMAASWLLARGHRRIGYLQLLTPENRPAHYSERDRALGFSNRLGEAGCPSEAVRAGMPGYTRHTGDAIATARRYLEEFPHLTAITCYGLEDAVALVAAAAFSGRRIPEDLDVLVFGERHTSSHVGCRLHTLIVPFSEIGRQAVAMAEATLSGGDQDPPSLIVPYAEDAIATRKPLLNEP